MVMSSSVTHNIIASFYYDFFIRRGSVSLKKEVYSLFDPFVVLNERLECVCTLFSEVR